MRKTRDDIDMGQNASVLEERRNLLCRHSLERGKQFELAFTASRFCTEQFFFVFFELGCIESLAVCQGLRTNIGARNEAEICLGDFDEVAEIALIFDFERIDAREFSLCRFVIE